MRSSINEFCKRANVITACAVFTLVMFSAAGFSSSVSAGMSGSYLELKGGMYSPSTSFSLKNVGIDNNTFDSDTKAGVNGELAVGHYFLPTVALELGIGYFKGKGSFATTPVHNMRFNVVPVVLTAKALVPVGMVNPYGEVGVGAYFTSFDVTDNASSFSGNTTLGLHAGAGLNVPITHNAFIGAEGRYITANPSFGDQKIRLNDTDYSLNGFKLNGFTTTLALGINF